MIFPATACFVQDALGGGDTPAFDISAACSGFAYALSVADKFIRTGTYRRILVVAADALSRFTDYTDRGSCILFGDGAGAVVLEPTADGAFSARLTLNNVPVPAGACLAKGDMAAAALDEALDLGIIANCAELLGNMERALELTLDYLKTRKQFGQAIGSFQVLQHRTVDLWMKLQVTQHALNGAVRRAMAPDVPRNARALAASGLKARAAEEAHKMANETVQLHGAIGYTDEYDLSLYVNRSLTLVPFLGNAAEHRRRYDNLRQTAGAQA